ncbi:MAG: hypothetical protein LBI03_02975 [Clostridiales bacterium]|jgi:hypothetical protein|nr:hypothetical protein [Clostridiales bacterium]
MDNKTLIKLWENDTKRKAFLDAYKEWGEWINTPELALRYYRYILPDGTAIIAMEYKNNLNNYVRKETDVLYYVQHKGSFICPGYSSRLWSVADLLKKEKVRMQQEGKKKQ